MFTDVAFCPWSFTLQGFFHIKLILCTNNFPTTQEAMFAVLIDRLDDLDDLLCRDDSPREAWALIKEEKTMRREIARAIQSNSNHVYTVDQVCSSENRSTWESQRRARCWWIRDFMRNSLDWRFLSHGLKLGIWALLSGYKKFTLWLRVRHVSAFLTAPC